MSIVKTIHYYGVTMSKTICVKFGKNLRKFRKSGKLTQQRLAEMANIEYKYIQRLEGKNPPAARIDTIERLAKVLKIKASELLE